MCGPQEEFQLNGKKALSSHSTKAKDRSLSAVATGRFLFCLYREKVIRGLSLARDALHASVIYASAFLFVRRSGRYTDVCGNS